MVLGGDTLPHVRLVSEEAGHDRQRVLLFENDDTLESVLCELFADEGLDVTVCGSLTELEAGVKNYPRAVVVSDSWSGGDYHSLSSDHRAEILALTSAAEVVLITARPWARSIGEGELGTPAIFQKPFDLGQLLVVVRAALARAARGAKQRSPSLVSRTG